MIMTNAYLFTSESVTEGHPDKLADQISDAVLDAMIKQDKHSRVACETLVTTGLAIVAGEITSKSLVSIPDLVRNVIKDVGYDDPDMGYDWRSCGILVSIKQQSPDIAMGVNKKNDKLGAGDQGMMFGFAIDETPTLMPAPIYYANALVKKLSEVRKHEVLPFLRPDGKSQITFEYKDGRPVEVKTVVIAAQHTPDVTTKKLKESIIEEVIKKVIPARLMSKNIKFFINPTGRFVVGGPHGDTGLTGRKIIVDTYGGFGRHGGGAFSGKDPSKVDRSGSYMARYIAKNIVAAGLAKKCEVQLAYAIGVPEPVSIMIDTFGTGKVEMDEIRRAVVKTFAMDPAGIIRELNLLEPIYRKTAAYGHFGRTEPGFTWEKIDKVKALQNEVGK
ncbi:MAG: methionine adenosyltransferase [Deltaproteobacteria bacterium]|nr:methionine adenosyltransferase [Deltaproteobacteria bacterium]